MVTMDCWPLGKVMASTAAVVVSPSGKVIT